MAKLGKGLLGAPTGVIGNINCYNRLGKSIIQSRSYPVDSYHRRWNLLKSVYTAYLLLQFDGLIISWQNTWLVGAPVGVSARDHYLLKGLEFFYQLQGSSLYGFRLRNLPSLDISDFAITSNWSQGLVSVTVPSSSSLRSYLADVHFSLWDWKNNVPSALLSRIMPYTDNNPIVFELSPALMAGKTIFSIRIQIIPLGLFFGHYTTGASKL